MKSGKSEGQLRTLVISYIHLIVLGTLRCDVVFRSNNGTLNTMILFVLRLLAWKVVLSQIVEGSG